MKKIMVVLVILLVSFNTFESSSHIKKQLGGGKCEAWCFIGVAFKLLGVNACYCKVECGEGTVPYCKTGFASVECTCNPIPRSVSIPTSLPAGWQEFGSNLVNFCSNYGSPRMNELGNRITQVITAILNNDVSSFNYWEDMVDLQYDELTLQEVQDLTNWLENYNP